MGRRGPRPTPLNQLAARGSWRGKAGHQAPEPEASAPPCPSWLRKEAKQIWAALCDELSRMGTLASTDARTMARYCDAYARWQGTAEFLAKHGDIQDEVLTVEQKKTRVRFAETGKPWPEVKIYNALSATLLRLEQEFGLTPSSRSRIATTSAEAATKRTTPSPTGRPVLRIAQ